MVCWRILAACLIVFASVAGCLGGNRGTDDVAPSASIAPPSSSTAPSAMAPATTGELHILPGAVLTTLRPTAGEAQRIPIPSPASLATFIANNAGSGSDPAQWNFTWPENRGMVRGNISLVVDVEGTVVNGFAPLASNATTCFIQFDILFMDPSQGPGGNQPPGVYACDYEPAVVPTGVRTLHFPFEVGPSRYGKGFGVSMSITGLATAQSPDARVDLLTGSVQQDSTVTFEAVGWPADLGQVTLVTTT
jgi:hypothetical protein